LTDSEIRDVMEDDLVGRLATIDGDGYPHVTPMWFHWRKPRSRPRSPTSPGPRLCCTIVVPELHPAVRRLALSDLT
jgi:hypothetical protein